MTTMNDTAVAVDEMAERLATALDALRGIEHAAVYPRQAFERLPSGELPDVRQSRQRGFRAVSPQEWGTAVSAAQDEIHTARLGQLIQGWLDSPRENDDQARVARAERRMDELHTAVTVLSSAYAMVPIPLGDAEVAAPTWRENDRLGSYQDFAAALLKYRGVFLTAALHGVADLDRLSQMERYIAGRY